MIFNKIISVLCISIKLVHSKPQYIYVCSIFIQKYSIWWWLNFQYSIYFVILSFFNCNLSLILLSISAYACLVSNIHAISKGLHLPLLCLIYSIIDLRVRRRVNYTLNMRTINWVFTLILLVLFLLLFHRFHLPNINMLAVISTKISQILHHIV